MCGLVFHAWSKWEEQTRMGFRNVSTSEMLIAMMPPVGWNNPEMKHMYRVQRRVCTRCGLIKERNL